MENSIDREFSGIRLKTLKKLFNFPYKIATKIPKIANYFQAKNKFDENSKFNSLKYQIKQN
jgi:hypothetical protein